ncbi:hypothetical protein ACVGW7_02835, partial [Enterobacter intestinihominis]
GMFYSSYGPRKFCRLPITLTVPTVEAAVGFGANAYPAFGPSWFCRVALTLTRPTVRAAVAGWRSRLPGLRFEPL